MNLPFQAITIRTTGLAVSPNGLRLQLQPHNNAWWEVVLKGNNLPNTIKIYPDSAHKNRKEEAFTFPQAFEGHTSRIINLSTANSDQVILTISPTEENSELTVVLRRIPQWLACQIMAKKLQTKLPKLGGRSNIFSKCWRRLQKAGYNYLASELFGDYELAIGCPGSWQAIIHNTMLNKINPHPHIAPASLLPSSKYGILFVLSLDINQNKKTMESILNQHMPVTTVWVIHEKNNRHLKWGETLLQLASSRGITIKHKQREHLNNQEFIANELSTCQWIGWIYAGDRYHPEITSTLAKNTTTDTLLIYTDHDHLDTNNTRHTPWFKSDWNPDWLYSFDYISRPVFIEASLLNKTLNSWPAISAIAPYPVVLAASKELTTKTVAHISTILFHQANRPTEQHLADQDLQNLLMKLLPHVSITTDASLNNRRLCWPLPSTPPLISLIIPTKDHKEILATCINSILTKTDYPNFELIIVDNNSRCQNTLEYLKEIAQDKRIQVLKYNKPFNYSAINNFAVTHCHGTLLGFINNDIEVIDRHWLSEMASHALRNDIGCVGAKLLYENNTIQHAGVTTGLMGPAGHGHKYFPSNAHGYMGRLISTQACSAVTAACMIIRKTIFEKAGGFDANNLPITYNDIDLCLRVQKLGYTNIWTPWAKLYHHESLSRNSNNTKTKKPQAEAVWMHKRWGATLFNDPYYNPNLTLSRVDFAPLRRTN